MESSLVSGGKMRQRFAPLLTYPTRTPPQINADTHILAAVHADIREASPELDGWFLSDFYAFNLLFKGLGRSQTWLTAAVSYKTWSTFLPSFSREQRLTGHLCRLPKKSLMHTANLYTETHSRIEKSSLAEISWTAIKSPL